MKILLISYGIPEFDGRLRELVRVFKNLGELSIISRSQTKSTFDASEYDNWYSFPVDKTKSRLGDIIGFYGFSRKVASTLKNIDVVIADDRMAIVPVMFAARKVGAKHIVHDAREFYRFHEVNHLIGKIGSIVELLFMRRFDLIICAGKERAEEMKTYYKLSSVPIVYENVRELSYGNESNMNAARRKFEKYFKDNDKMRIISSNGLLLERQTDVLLNAFAELDDSYELYLAGAAPEHDRKVVESIINSKKLIGRVHFLGKLSEPELKYVVSSCQIGFVGYSMKTMNDRLCASGKVYEYVFEGLPIVTTINPPLNRFCNEHGVGISTENFSEAIRQITSKYDKYRAKVEVLRQNIRVSDLNNRLILQLREHL